MSRVTKAIILAAGKSTRYGKNKLVDQWLQSVDEIEIKYTK